MTVLHGLLIALASATLYAVTVNIIPLAQAVGGSAALYLAVRGIVNSTAPLLINRQSRWPAIIAAKQHPTLLIMLGLFTGIQGLGYVVALHLLPISIATPLFFLFPIFTYLLQKFSRRKKLHLIALLALSGSSTGIWLLAQGDSGDSSLFGIACAVASAMSQAIVNAALTRLGRLNPWQITHICYLPGLFVFNGYLVWLLAADQYAPSLEAVGWTIFSAAIFFFGSVLFFQAVKMIGAIRTANIMYIEPMMSVGLSILLHNDHIDASKLIAIGLILCSTISLEWWENKTRNQHQHNP